MTEEKVREMLKQELASAAEMLLNDTAKSHSNAMTEDKIREILKQELAVTAKRLQEMFSTRLDVMANHFGGFIDRERAARGKADEKLRALSDRVSSLQKEADGIEELRDELRKGYEGHQMQIMHLSSWVNAFNTRRMYNDIVAHINATTPTGLYLSNQMRALSGRLDALENKEGREDEGGVKKRKVPDGNAVLIHNGR
ncbi:hypothetical protein QQZ08_010563 [Neonectria magnoliae]|uniref:Uncharacterized protein n=1 Tax=Neonectria magnoliae TaxID=2732573 RepID=A0ABR1HGK5_9HYPO